jgi:hypothetical protein
VRNVFVYIAYIFNFVFQGTGDQRMDSQGMFSVQLDTGLHTMYGDA